MNYRRLSDGELINFATNVAAVLGGTTLSSVNAAVRTSLVAAIGSLPGDYNDQVMSATTAETARKSAVSTKNGTRERLIAVMTQVRDALRAGLAPTEHYDLCGFDSPLFTGARTYIAQDPTDLSAFGYSNGVNIVKFKGNNSLNSVVYEVWRRSGDQGPWALLSTTKRQSFTDTPVTPGQYYEYKVRAAASKSVSNFSNSAVVYGVS
jgi:hypothetical protein